jgi:hypothetical protein
MSFLEVLEVAIGLVFVWLLMSVAVMQTQEWIVGWLALRADGLEEAIWGLLANPKPALNIYRRTEEQARKLANRWFKANWQIRQAPPLVKELYRHPLIKGLARAKSKPSYIPADKFALALFDVVITAGKPESAIQEAIQQFEQDLNTLQELKPEHVKELKETLGRLLNTGDDAFQDAYDLFRLEQPLLAAVLAHLGVDETTDAANAKGALNKLREQLELEDLSPVVEAVRTAKAALKEVEGLSAVQSTLNGLKQSNPEIIAFTDALEPILDKWLETKPPENEDEMLAQIMNGAVALAWSNPGLQRALGNLVGNAKIYAADSEKAIALARTNVETWFNDTMDRASGWYKRNRQIGAFVIALVFAALINVDSINIATHLWREPTLRQAVAAQAEQYKLPVVGDSGQATSQGPQDVEDLETTFGELQQSLQKLNLPIGWKQRPQGWGILSTLGGLIITAGAATLGAPFWFDILQKLIGIRSAGKVPEPGSASEG